MNRANEDEIQEMNSKKLEKIWDDTVCDSEKGFETNNVSMSFIEYLEAVKDNKNLIQNAFRRMFNMLHHFGMRKVSVGDAKINRYNLFDDPFDQGVNAVYGIDRNLEDLVAFFRSAADNSSLSHRILILHGPKGSAKSTIVNLFKKGLELYSKTGEGCFYTLDFVEQDKFLGFDTGNTGPLGKYNISVCPISEEPLHLLTKIFSEHPRGKQLKQEYEEYLEMDLTGELCPFCNERFNLLNDRCKGNLDKILQLIRVKKLSISRNNRVGIGVIDSLMEEDVQALVGYAVDTLPGGRGNQRNKEFFLDGEMNVANRGLLEVKEIFRGVSKYGLSQKLKRLMSASQEHIVKPGNCPEMEIDEVLIGHTNPLQYDILLTLEDDAFISRLISFDIPHLLIAAEEEKIYRKEFVDTVYPSVHFSPHLFSTIAGFAVMSRLTDDLVEKDSAERNVRSLKGRRNSIELKKEYEGKRYDVKTIYEKYRCYNGETLRVGSKTLDVLNTMVQSAKNGEGLGIGFDPRYFQNLLSFIIMNEICAVEKTAENTYVKCITPMMVIDSIKLNINEDKGLTAQKSENYYGFLECLVERYKDQVIEDVEDAMGLGQRERRIVLERYLKEISKLVKKETERDPFSQKVKPADEEFLNKIESYINNKNKDYRSDLLNVVSGISSKWKPENLEDHLEYLLRKLNQKKPELASAIKNYLEDYHGEQIRKIRKAMKNMIEFGKVAAEELKSYETFRNQLIENKTYCGHCVNKIIGIYANEKLSSVERVR